RLLVRPLRQRVAHPEGTGCRPRLARRALPRREGVGVAVRTVAGEPVPVPAPKERTMKAVLVNDPSRTRRWGPYLQRYRRGEWRDRIFHDMTLEDGRRLGQDLTFLDIGCGRGFDDSVPLQRSLASASGRYVGIEPDPEVVPGEYITEMHRCLFEDAP